MPRHTRRTAAAAAAAAAATEPTDLTPSADAPESAEPAAKRVKTAREPIALGDAIPEGEVVNQDGKPVNLAEQYGSGVLALYAYPKASTPGCTRQTEGFGEAFSELASLGVTVFGISADSPTSQTTFRNKTGIEFDLLSDPQYTLLEPLGAKKHPKGVVRSHWVFVDGKALLVEHQVKPDASPARVVHAIKEAIKNGTDGGVTDAPETRIERDSASGKPETASELATEPLEALENAADEKPQQEAAEKDAEQSAEQSADEKASGSQDTVAEASDKNGSAKATGAAVEDANKAAEEQVGNGDQASADSAKATGESVIDADETADTEAGGEPEGNGSAKATGEAVVDANETADSKVKESSA